MKMPDNYHAAALLPALGAIAQESPPDTEAQLNRALELIEQLAGTVAARETRVEQLEAVRQGAASSP